MHVVAGVNEFHEHVSMIRLSICCVTHVLKNEAHSLLRNPSATKR